MRLMDFLLLATPHMAQTLGGPIVICCFDRNWPFTEAGVRFSSSVSSGGPLKRNVSVVGLLSFSVNDLTCPTSRKRDDVFPYFFNLAFCKLT